MVDVRGFSWRCSFERHLFAEPIHFCVGCPLSVFYRLVDIGHPTMAPTMGRHVAVKASEFVFFAESSQACSYFGTTTSYFAMARSIIARGEKSVPERIAVKIEGLNPETKPTRWDLMVAGLPA